MIFYSCVDFSLEPWQINVWEKNEKQEKKSPKKASKQKKMDDFLVKKGEKSSPVASSANKRSSALKAKNYR